MAALCLFLNALPERTLEQYFGPSLDPPLSFYFQLDFSIRRDCQPRAPFGYLLKRVLCYDPPTSQFVVALRTLLVGYEEYLLDVLIV